MMTTATPHEIISDKSSLGTGSVRYYFDILTDESIRPQIACKASEIFNKDSYYVSLDFDCDAKSAHLIDKLLSPSIDKTLLNLLMLFLIFIKCILKP